MAFSYKQKNSWVKHISAGIIRLGQITENVLAVCAFIVCLFLIKLTFQKTFFLLLYVSFSHRLLVILIVKFHNYFWTTFSCVKYVIHSYVLSAVDCSHQPSVESRSYRVLAAGAAALNIASLHRFYILYRDIPSMLHCAPYGLHSKLVQKPLKMLN